MLEYAPMLHVSYYAQNYAGIIRQGLTVIHQVGLDEIPYRSYRLQNLTSRNAYNLSEDDRTP